VGFAGVSLAYANNTDTLFIAKSVAGFGMLITKLPDSSVKYTVDTTTLKSVFGNILTFNNGLTNTSGLVQLSGPLVKNTTITNGTFQFNITSSSSSVPILNLTGTGDGDGIDINLSGAGIGLNIANNNGDGIHVTNSVRGISVSSPTGILTQGTILGIEGIGTSGGVGGQFASDSGPGLIGLSGTGVAITGQSTVVIGNSTPVVFELQKIIAFGNIPSVGYGLEFDWQLPNTSSPNSPSTTAKMSMIATNVTSGAFSNDYHISLMNGASFPGTDQFILSSTGELQLAGIPGLGGVSDTTTYKPAVFDASGNLRRATNWAGGGGASNLQAVLTAGNTTSLNAQFYNGDSLTITPGGLLLSSNHTGSGTNTFWTYKPQNYGTNYVSSGTTQWGWNSGYAIYPGVNPDNRPNVVFQTLGYNAFIGGNRINTSDGSWSERLESHYQIGGGGAAFERHYAEMDPVNGMPLMRFLSLYAYKNADTAHSLTTGNGGFFIEQGIFSHEWADYVGGTWAGIEAPGASTTGEIFINIDANKSAGNTNGAIDIRSQTTFGDNFGLFTSGTGGLVGWKLSAQPLSLGGTYVASGTDYLTAGKLVSIKGIVIDANAGTAIGDIINFPMPNVGTVLYTIKDTNTEIDHLFRNHSTGGTAETDIVFENNNGYFQANRIRSYGSGWSPLGYNFAHPGDLFLETLGTGSGIGLNADWSFGNGKIYFGIGGIEYARMANGGHFLFNTTTDAGGITNGATVQVNGSLSTKIVTVSATTYTVLQTDHTVIFTGTTNTLTFPTPETGRELYLVNHGSGSVTLGTAVTTGNGVTSTTITAGSSYQIQYDGTVWRKVN